MVTVTELKGSFGTQESSTEESLREERRRTGRYVASVIAIFVSLFGLYQAMARGTPEYAALFLPALIMFFYVLWILYASRSRNKIANEQPEIDEDLIDLEAGEENPVPVADTTNSKPSTSSANRTFSRSYSVA